MTTITLVERIAMQSNLWAVRGSVNVIELDAILADVRELERDARRYSCIRNPAFAIVYVKDENAWGPGAIGHSRYENSDQLDSAVDAILTKTGAIK